VCGSSVPEPQLPIASCSASSHTVIAHGVRFTSMFVLAVRYMGVSVGTVADGETVIQARHGR
jgi:hypothetical protein